MSTLALFPNMVLMAWEDVGSVGSDTMGQSTGSIRAAWREVVSHGDHPT